MTKIKNIVNNSDFHFVKLIGQTNQEIGFSHGQQLKEAIKKNILFYIKTFEKTENELIEMSTHFKNKILEFDSDIFQEIQGIAEGAEVPDWQIFLLNARSEIFSNVNKISGNASPQECTLVFFPELAILSENWDFASAVAAQTYLFSIEKAGKPKILTLSEAGIVAKIGLNENGVGIGMNFLDSVKELDGVPIHVQIRKSLEQNTLARAADIFYKNGAGISGNICVADQSGNFINFELDGAKIFTQKNITGQKYFCHTNHFLSPGNEDKTPDEDSVARISQVANKMDKNNLILDEEFAKNILLDQTHPKFPLLVTPFLDPFFPRLGEIGTNAFVMLSLKEREIKVAYQFENFKNLYIHKIY